MNRADLRREKSSLSLRTSAAPDLGLDASADGRTILCSRVDTSINDLMLVENFR
jgi:hypothetical protein